MANGLVRRTAIAALLAIALAGAGPAAAKTDTLARGAMDLVGTPLDVALFPVTTTTSFVRKYYVNSDASVLHKIMWTPVVGGVYAISCVAITGTNVFMRLMDGIVNVPVGLATIASDTQPDTTIYEPISGKALVDYHGIYFGGYHCEGFFQ